MKKRRILAIVLVVALLLGITSLAAFASQPVSYSTQPTDDCEEGGSSGDEHGNPCNEPPGDPDPNPQGCTHGEPECEPTATDEPTAVLPTDTPVPTDTEEPTATDTPEEPTATDTPEGPTETPTDGPTATDEPTATEGPSPTPTLPSPEPTDVPERHPSTGPESLGFEALFGLAAAGLAGIGYVAALLRRARG